MAATGDEAAAMDSISREPASLSATLNAAGSSGAPAERLEGEAKNPVIAPKKTGANSDGGVETAEEAVEPAEPDINELCSDMFEKMAVFLQGELTATCEDYRLLENMNKLTSLKYMEMKDISINISRNLQDLNNKCSTTSRDVHLKLESPVFYLALRPIGLQSQSPMHTRIHTLTATPLLNTGTIWGSLPKGTLIKYYSQ
ncbi:biogenesis of lysosome-related organelles complex 1 subunit 2 isoform X1 [Oryzias melastigma]|uniref:biogenesis of lysosome-related organelles complex 1 subunit 2 isoform X1 n=1 Tax=Oryzias melastigma TaxID=30732 RepID=UPI000CF836AF|nr:biogenesis of lysosome-related organelles complex 1 subunit 2 isoform X1 [Oryzias melastigma]